MVHEVVDKMECKITWKTLININITGTGPNQKE